MTDRPAFRIWPPVARGVPLLAGVVLTKAWGDLFSLPRDGGRVVGITLCVVFAIWNGWTLVSMAASRTAILPGGATRTILDRGPFRFSRNPLYIGLIALDVGLAVLWPSAWALDRYADLFDDDLDALADRLDEARERGLLADFLRTEPKPILNARSSQTHEGQEIRGLQTVETRRLELPTPALQRRCSAS